MPISRRHLLRRLGAVAAAAAAQPRAEASSGPALPGGVIRLNRNQNPRGASPKVVATMLEAAQHAAGCDPDVESEALREKIARFHSVTPEQVVLVRSNAVWRLSADQFRCPFRDHDLRATLLRLRISPVGQFLT